MKSPFDDAILYDWEYRRRRQDVAFYRLLADERGGPILDAGCGTGRLLVPLARDGHVVVGVDRAAGHAGARRVAARARRAAGAKRVRCWRAATWGRFRRAAAASRWSSRRSTPSSTANRTRALAAFFAGAAAALIPGGWLAFDAFAPSARFLDRRGLSGVTRFRHPRTGRLTAYRESHTVEPGPDGAGKPILAMRFRYSDVRGGRGRVVSLRHRLWTPAEVGAALERAGLTVIGRWSGFDGAPLEDPPAANSTSTWRAGATRPAVPARRGAVQKTRIPPDLAARNSP